MINVGTVDRSTDLFLLEHLYDETASTKGVSTFIYL